MNSPRLLFSPFLDIQKQAKTKVCDLELCSTNAESNAQCTEVRHSEQWGEDFLHEDVERGPFPKKTKINKNKNKIEINYYPHVLEFRKRKLSRIDFPKNNSKRVQITFLSVIITHLSLKKEELK